MNKTSFDLKNLVDFVTPYANKLKDLVPQEKLVPSVGLDIGTSSVKLIQLQKTGSESKIIRFGVAPIKNRNKEEAINKVLAENNITTKNVNTSVSGQGVILRYAQLPKMSLEDLRTSVILESDKYIPFPAEEVNIDCYIIKELPQDKKMLVLVAAAKKDLIEQRISLLEKIGLVPDVISIDSVALANVFNVFCQTAAATPDKKEPESLSCQTIGVLNIGGTFSSLDILDKGLPLFTRDIFIGGNDITKRIINQFSLSEEEAEKMKSSTEADAAKIISASETILTNLATEIRFSFDYFETENNLPITTLYITGGGSYLKGVDNFLQQSLGIEVKIWNPLTVLQIDPEVSAELLKKQANKIGIALGLALYQNDQD